MKSLTLVLLIALSGCATHVADVKRFPLAGGSTFPIARAVVVPPGSTLVFHSGTTPAPANESAEKYSPDYWGDTQTQALSVFNRLRESLTGMGIGFGDVVSMTVYLVGDPAQGGKMDFAGFMTAYSQFFGTAQQPKLPARSTVQVAGLAAPGMLVEVEVTLATAPKS